MTTTIEFPVERDDGEIVLTINGTVEPFVPAMMRGNPDGWEPPSGGSIEIEEILLGEEEWTGELTEKERDAAEQALIDAYGEEEQGKYEAAAESRADAREERWDD